MFVSIQQQSAGRELVVAILTYDCFDEWLEDIGVSMESFCQEMMGTWQFNYIQALQRAGIRSVLIFTSSRVDSPTRFVHKPTGATICILPSSKIYRLVKKWRCGISPDAGANVAVAYARRAGRSVLGLAASYLSTPLGLLRQELHREDCHCVLVEQYENPRFDLTVLLGRLLRTPVFGTFTDPVPRQNWWRHPFRRLAVRHCAGLAICAEGEVRRVKKTYDVPEEKLARIQYPVDTSIWYPSARQEMRRSLDIPGDAKVLIYHGRIELWHKGLDILISAWEQVCREHPGQDVRLILIGTGFDAQQLSEILSVRKLRGVKWINRWVHDRNMLRRYLSAADAYVFPSRVDAFGIAVIEAMACGLPIVAAAAPGICDILKDGEHSGGLVVPTEDAAALAAAIERLLTDQELALNLAKSALSRIETSFSLETVGLQLRDFLIGHEYRLSSAVQ